MANAICFRHWLVGQVKLVRGGFSARELSALVWLREELLANTVCENGNKD
jgi:hypothetical protein